MNWLVKWGTRESEAAQSAVYERRLLLGLRASVVLCYPVMLAALLQRPCWPGARVAHAMRLA